MELLSAPWSSWQPIPIGSCWRGGNIRRAFVVKSWVLSGFAEVSFPNRVGGSVGFAPHFCGLSESWRSEARASLGMPPPFQRAFPATPDCFSFLLTFQSTIRTCWSQALGTDLCVLYDLLFLFLPLAQSMLQLHFCFLYNRILWLF